MRETKKAEGSGMAVIDHFDFMSSTQNFYVMSCRLYTENLSESQTNIKHKKTFKY